MKKVYILPALKSLDVNEETLMLGVSTGDGVDLNIDDNPGDAGSEGLGKSYIWD